jgi:hypothetical protein
MHAAKARSVAHRGNRDGLSADIRGNTAISDV